MAGNSPALRLLQLYSLVLLVVGLAVLAGGGYLASLGGSLYYSVAGLAVVISAILLWRRNRDGAYLYGIFLFATVIWSVYEVGLDGWSLMPRLAGPFVLGIGLLVPAFRRLLRPGRRQRPVSFSMALSAVVVSVGLGLILNKALITEAPDPAFQTGQIDLSAAQFAADDQRNAAAGADWRYFGGNSGGSRFSSLAEISPETVGKLELAWTYRVGHIEDSTVLPMLQTTPLKIGNVLYLCSGKSDIIALDAETGEEIWRFDPETDLTQVSVATCRGVAYYEAPSDTGLCARRIIANTVDARLLAVDAGTGQPCADFGAGGQISLLEGMADYKGEFIKGYYFPTSAPTIVRGNVIVGGWVSDGQYWGQPSGVIRAFDAVTGAFAWAFDVGRLDRQTLPPEGENFTPGTPNSWGPMSADPELGLVYAPTGNATPDYYGVQRRSFDNDYASSVVAIDAETGKLRWSFQTLHYDIWDYDVASQPVLVNLEIGGEMRRALVQPTKRGEIFVLDRETGVPLTSVQEMPVPQTGAVPSEHLSPTQPFSVGMPSFRGPDLTERDMWGITPLDQLWCRIKFREARYDGTLTPPGLTPAVIYPGYLGGMNWGSVAVDTDRNIMIVNSNRIANYLQLITRDAADEMGLRPRGDGDFDYVGGAVPQARTPYAALVGPFVSPLGAPCQRPPYGMLTAVDLNSQKLVWTKRLGNARHSGPFGISSGLPITMGTPNLAGSLVTRGGVTFIGAAQDQYLRAVNTVTGETIWKADLPAGGIATPMTYISPESGRQFVVIAAGGNKVLQARTGDYILAYALPKETSEP